MEGREVGEVTPTGPSRKATMAGVLLGGLVLGFLAGGLVGWSPFEDDYSENTKTGDPDHPDALVLMCGTLESLDSGVIDRIEARTFDPQEPGLGLLSAVVDLGQAAGTTTGDDQLRMEALELQQAISRGLDAAAIRTQVESLLGRC